MILCFFLTAMIFGGYFFAAALWGVRGIVLRLVVAGLLTSVQIVLTELLLGIVGYLYLAPLVAINTAIACFVIVRSWPGIFNGLNWWGFDQRKTAIFRMLLARNGVFLFLLLLAAGWISLAVWLLPPRGVDDLTYHLPPVYQYIQQGRISILSLNIRPHFAFPQNAELLFLWPTIFAGNITFVDGVQLIFALWGLLVVYALARVLGVRREWSFLAGIVFFFSPVVLMQAGSNYIDLITGTILLVAILMTVLFSIEGNKVFFYTAVIACGLLSGMKYGMLIFCIPIFLFFLCCCHSKIAFRDWMIAGFIFIMCCGYWYARNLFVLGHCFFPAKYIFNGDGGVFGSIGWQDFNIFWTDILQKLYLLVVKDVGLGSYNGGYGVIFWWLGVPAMIFCSFNVWQRRDRVCLFLLAMVFLGICVLLVVPYKDFIYAPRFILFIVGIAAVVLAKVSQGMKFRFVRGSVRLLVIAGCCSGLYWMAMSGAPSYDIRSAFIDKFRGAQNSSFKYMNNSYWILPRIGVVSERLNAIKSVGYCIQLNSDTYLTGNYFGEKLQNKIFNLGGCDLPEIFVIEKLQMERMKFNISFKKKMVFDGKNL